MRKIFLATLGVAGILSVGIFFGAAITQAIAPSVVFAETKFEKNLVGGEQGVFGTARTIASGGKATEADPVKTIWNLIQVVLGLLGMMMVLIFLYAGFLYFNARGVATEVTKAQDMIKQAVVGMIIIASAWGIGYFVINAIAGAVTQGESSITLLVSPVYAETTEGHMAAGVGDALLGGPFSRFITESGAPKDPNYLVTVIQNLINILLGFLGVGMVLLFLYAGFLYLTAAGDSKATEKAVEIIKQAVIGTIIILSAWGLSWFVINTLVTRLLSSSSGSPY